MAVVNSSTREINAKIVYYGPGRSGKTTNIQYIHAKLKPEHKGELMTLSTEQDRTLFFDFLPVDLGDVKGLQTRFHLYTVPGQVFYNSTRKLVLKNADGVVFVADSERRYLSENVESFNNLLENLRAHGRQPADLPLIIQYNKRDTPDAMSIAELDAAINKFRFPTVQAVAARGEGVLQTLTMVSKLVMRHLSTAANLSTDASTLAPPSGAVPADSPLAPDTLEGGLDDEESAVLDSLGRPPPAAAPPAAAAMPPRTSAATAASRSTTGPAKLELVSVGEPVAGAPGEIRFTLELRDPATGARYRAPVTLSIDTLLTRK